jgi:hypothetical protein
VTGSFDSRSRSSKSAPLTAIYTDIGRGHPNYLDSVLRTLKRDYPDQFEKIQVVSVFQIARRASLLAWKIVRLLYRVGSRGGVVTSLYSRLRSTNTGYSENSFLFRLLARDLRRILRDYHGICLVAHPLLAEMLRGLNRVFYLHGEIAAPCESAISGCESIYVPLPSTRERMTSLGMAGASLVETGLLLEPELVDDLQAVVRDRIERLKSDKRLTIGFFISGAYPRRHIRLILAGARACHNSGMNVRLFWGCDRRQVARLISRIGRSVESLVVDGGSGPPDLSASFVVVSGTNREAETLRCLQYLPSLDLFCAAPHERVNWAVGAGLAIIMIVPPIGSFAPENLKYVADSNCGFELSHVDSFKALPEIVSEARLSGNLAQMAEHGFGRWSIKGAAKVASHLAAQIQEISRW